MATLNIKAAQLKVIESAQLQKDLQQELEELRAKAQEQEVDITTLLNENTLLSRQVTDLTKENSTLQKRLKAKLKEVE